MKRRVFTNLSLTMLFVPGIKVKAEFPPPDTIVTAYMDYGAPDLYPIAAYFENGKWYNEQTGCEIKTPEYWEKSK